MTRLRFTQTHHSPELLDHIREAWADPKDLWILGHPDLDLSSLALPEELDLDPGFGLFSSGSTQGGSRLVFFEKSRMIKALDKIAQLFNWNRVETIFSYPQPYHIFGFALGYLLSIHTRNQLAPLTGRYHHDHHQKWIFQSRVSQGALLTLGTPAHFFDLLSFVKNQNHIPGKSYSAIIGGARVTKDLWKNIQAILQIEAPSIGYGCTEASPGITHLPPGSPPITDGDIGELLPGVQVDLQETGGYRFRSDGMCQGYFEHGTLFRPEWIEVSDQIESDNSRHWIFKGRTDHQINRGGTKLNLEEIETKLEAFLNRSVVVFPMGSDRLGQDLGVVVEESTPLPENGDSLREKCQSFFRKHYDMGIDARNIQVWASFPRNRNQKIDRLAIRKGFLRS